ncbi:MAG: HK97 family phage prohead protease [Terriglobales bacterium]
MKNVIERRFMRTEVRAKKAGDGPSTVSGYAAVFNQVTDLGYFREIIVPGAFKRALQEGQDVRCLFNHDPNYILGRTKSKTLTLSEDTNGLMYECEAPATEIARSILTSIERGDVDGSSFGFTVRKQEWIEEKDEEGRFITTRKILDADLFDVSPVVFPAYDGTTSEARSRMFPGGMPEEVRAHLKRDDEDGECQCPCDPCQNGDCADCDMDYCDDPYCNHAGDDEEENSRRPKGERRGQTTKRVDGEDLTARCFLIVGDKTDMSTWKLPWKFSTDEKTKSHLRNAVARFNQLKGVSEEQKKSAWSKLKRLCKKYGVDVSEENSKKWNLTDVQFRALRSDAVDPDGDGDDDSDVINALQDAADAVDDYEGILDQAADDYDADSLRAVSTEGKKVIAMIEKAMAAAEKELSEADEDDDTERARMRVRALKAGV